jgi:hypothetical protein
MTIYELLELDHRAICDLLARLSETASSEAMLRRALFASLRHLLLRHAQTEQDIFYAALLEQGADKEMVFDAIEDHAALAFMLGEVETLSVNDGKWLEALNDLSLAVQRHFRMEEDVIFERAREQLADGELVESVIKQ